MTSNHTEINKGNILIVDDTPENLQVLSATLSERGYKIRGVINGKMAVRAARSAPPDLILLDIRMPDTNGYEVCEELKADAQTSQIPVIFISALDEVLDKVKAFQVGGEDYITKPFQVEEVVARVEHQLTIQRLQKQLMQQNEQLQKEIVERKKAEESAAAASKAKSEFLANMSHELRTPLNAILGFTQVMIRDPFLSTDQLENLRIINRSGEHLLDLINDVLDMSKIEAGIITICETSFDLYRLLDTLEEMFHFKAEKKGLKLRFTVHPDVPHYIKTDEKKLRVCLINLLGNAIKFTENGSVTLRVNLGVVNSEPGLLYTTPSDCEPFPIIFEVEDTGVGIAPEEIDSLFDPFVQSEAGRKSAEGTGLGLTITRKFVQLLHGNITAISALNKGTIFKFNIQISRADAYEVIDHPLQRVSALEADQGDYRILVVDDTQENRLLLVKLLQPIGFEVLEAENGEQALTLWESWQPHLILLDTRMPIMDGMEVALQIRAKEREKQEKILLNLPSQIQNIQSNIESSRTVIIALTASAFEERREEIIAAGCDDFVRKPFQEQVIFEKMTEFLGVRYMYEQLPPVTNTTPGLRYFISERPDSFFLPLLGEMPLSWVQQLNQAANEVNEDLVFQLIDTIPENFVTLGDALKDLLEDFRLDRIVRITQSIIESELGHE
ncbi:response regulator [Kamptonema sp. UHCC 0994]|uniref:response regulator n=1 Tax=Kamptonema sp. UHCC 0994 TaxID=3031329 RepID=UPI0023B95BB5|nr:response regulator [Kamptonema sp. UHCC 0994]MDF0552648.1 response regulator [Kamptonema sp. UHCC 0994]